MLFKIILSKWHGLSWPDGSQKYYRPRRTPIFEPHDSCKQTSGTTRARGWSHQHGRRRKAYTSLPNSYICVLTKTFVNCLSKVDKDCTQSRRYKTATRHKRRALRALPTRMWPNTIITHVISGASRLELVSSPNSRKRPTESPPPQQPNSPNAQSKQPHRIKTLKTTSTRRCAPRRAPPTQSETRRNNHI